MEMREIKPKQEEMMVSAGPGKMRKEKGKKIYPTFRMDLEHVPEAKDMKVGDMAHIRMHAKLVGLNQSHFDNSAEYEIHRISHRKLRAGEAGEDWDKKEESQAEENDKKFEKRDREREEEEER